MTKENEKKPKLDPGQFKDLLKEVDPETLDNLKKMAMELLGEQYKAEMPEEEKKEKREEIFAEEEKLTQELVVKMTGLVSALNKAVHEDPYVNEERFLLAVKPFAGEKGQKFCDQAVKMLKLTGVLQYILENKEQIIKG